MLLILLKLSQRLLGILSTLILARLLTPEQFGIIAIALLVLFFAEAMTDSGARQYIGQAETVDSQLVNSAWTLDLLLKLMATILLYLALPLTTKMWGSATVTSVIAAVIPLMLLRALANPHLHLEARNLNYSNIFRIELTQKIVGFCATVGMAVATASLWSIVVGAYAGLLTTLVGSYYLSNYRPRFSLVGVRSQWKFSQWIVGRAMVGYARSQLDSLIVSKVLPVRTYGAFSIAKDVTVSTTEQLVIHATAPLLPVFAKIKHNTSTHNGPEYVVNAILMVCWIVAPVATVFAVLREPVVMVLLGEKWFESADAILALSPLVYAVGINAVAIQIAIGSGRVGQLMFYDVFSLISILLIMYVQYQAGLFELLLSRTVVGTLSIACFTIISVRWLKVPVLKTAVALIVPALPGIVLFMATDGMNYSNTFISLMLNCMFVALYYLCCFLVITRVMSTFDNGWKSFSLMVKDLVIASATTLRQKVFG